MNNHLESAFGAGSVRIDKFLMLKSMENQDKIIDKNTLDVINKSLADENLKLSEGKTFYPIKGIS